jgi:calcineurin-like phosphoesterase family protein
MTWQHEVVDAFGHSHVIDLEHLVLWSDPHLNHNNILKYGRGDRWVTIESMNYSLLDELYDALSSPEDQLLILGDVVMGQRDLGLPLLGNLLAELPHTKAFLIPGNHDHCHPMHKSGGQPRCEAWVHKYTDLGRLTILPPELTFSTPEGDVTFCHFPFTGDHTDEVRYQEWRPEDRGQYLLHGHLHGTHGARTGPRSMDVGVDAWGYRPVPFKLVFKQLTTLDVYVPDLEEIR